MKSNPKVIRRFKIAYYAFPLIIGSVVGVSHFASQSLAVYLKYQAMVDSYHFKMQQNQASE
jgi:hypothetical protein